MCKFGIIKSIRRRFHFKHKSSNSDSIHVTYIKQCNIYITKVENADNFNPNATNVNNTYYGQEPHDEESDESCDEDKSIRD